MIPYPASSTDTLLFSDSAYLMNSIAGRSGAASGYVALATGRFAAAGYHHLALDGFYWLREIAEPEDTAVMRRVATAVHSHGLRYLWIPAYQVIGAPEWRTFGFDEAWHQPNYFFTPTIPPSRVNSAFTMARSWGMGIELEFNRRMFAAPEFHDRLIPYLAALDTAPDLRNGSIAIYDGAGGLVALAQAPAGPFRDLYRRLVRTLGSEPAGH